MASVQDQEEVEVQEIAQEIVIDTDGNTAGNVVDLTSDSEHGEQEMEIDGVGGNGTQNEDVQPQNDENNAPDDAEMQSSMQNVTPAVGRSVQVLGVLAVNSPDEFQNKAKPSSKTSSKVKSIKSPIKSPEKDDDVSLARKFLLFHHFLR